MSRAGAVSLLALLLTGCGTPEVRAVETGAGGVTYEFPLDRRAEAMREAMLYCANLGRTAVLRQVTEKGDKDGVAAFDCR